MAAQQFAPPDSLRALRFARSFRSPVNSAVRQHVPSLTMRKIARPLVISLLFASTLYSVEPDTYSPALIVLPSAEETKFSRFKGDQEVTYYRQDPFPAVDTIKRLHDSMLGKGWKELTEDFMNGTPLSTQKILSSHATDEQQILFGWRAGRAFKDPTLYTFHWYVEYESAVHEVVRYDISYTDKYDPSYHEYPYLNKVPPRANRLRVYGTYWPPQMAEGYRKLGEKFKSSQTKP